MPDVTFDRLAVFGDSLSDAGAIFRLTGEVLAVPFPLASAGYAGVLSNGPVYTQILPQLLGVDADVLAVASAQAIGTRPLWQVLGLDGGAPPFGEAPVAPLIRSDADLGRLAFDVNLSAQVDRFLTGPARPDTAASFFIGLNDVARLDTGSPAVLFEALSLLNGIVDATEAAADRVVAAGAADTLIFYGFPNAGFLPGAADLGGGARAALDAFIGLHKIALDDLAGEFEEDGTDATVIDLAALTREIDADPASFGFAAKGPILLGSGTDPEIGPPDAPGGLPTLSFPENPAVAGLDPGRVQFFDFLHPTSATHGVFAAFSAAWLTREAHVLTDFGTLRSFGGTDELVLARGGADILALGAGRDVALAGRGADTVFGGGGQDLLSGGSGDDSLFGGHGRDVLADGPGDDVANGGRGPDLLVDGAGSDLHLGRGGGDVFVWTGRNAPGDTDTLHGGAGVDTLYLAAGATTSAALDAARDGRSPWETALGLWDMPGVGLTVTGVENVALYDDPSDIVGVPADMVTDADLWGTL